MHPCVELSVADSFLFFRSRAVCFLSSESSCSLVCLCSEESFHSLCDDDFSSVVVDGCVRQVGVEDDRVVGCSGLDGPAELSRVCENGPAFVPDG